MIYLIVFFAQLLLIYLVSKNLATELFYLFRKFIRVEKVIFILISLIYIPGTILHELSHFFMAAALLLKVRDISILPEFESNYIKLGSVTYERKDFLRSVVVGIAPLFGGIAFFYTFSVIKIFPGDNLFLNILLIYLFFAISSTMFSSKQDLVDFIYLIPFILIVCIFIYIFQIDIRIIIRNEKIVASMIKFFKDINLYLFLGVIVNLSLLAILRIFNIFFKK